MKNMWEERRFSLEIICFFEGGIIALGVFGGFVFLAAIITTIVILIRR